MPHSAVSCAVLLGTLLATTAFAEHEPTGQAPASSPAQPSARPMPPAAAASEAERPSSADARPPGVIRPLEDPIDRLQRRLAETIGAKHATIGGSPYDVRLTARAEPHATTVKPVAAAAAPRVPRDEPPAVIRPARPGDWSYDGAEGPSAWARLAPEFAACATGQRQSPIDIRGGLSVELEPVEFDYRPSGFNVIDDGHTVQVNVGAGNSIGVLGRRYELVQFHFHRPSEERIDGRAYDMVVHLVHRDLEGRLAVIAVLLDRGSAQPVVQTVWNNLPLEKGEELPARAALDPAQLLPADRRYYTYMGSMTTPPCSEGVLWMVMKQPVSVSAEQIAIFSRLYPMNARPIQSASGRLIKESN